MKRSRSRRPRRPARPKGKGRATPRPSRLTAEDRRSLLADYAGDPESRPLLPELATWLATLET